MRIFTGLLVASLAIAASTAAERPARDHEQARSAVDAGDHLPLSEILRRIEKLHPGRVLEIERDREDGRALYEIELLDGNGRVIELIVDAATGEILRTEVDD